MKEMTGPLSNEKSKIMAKARVGSEKRMANGVTLTRNRGKTFASFMIPERLLTVEGHGKPAVEIGRALRLYFLLVHLTILWQARNRSLISWPSQSTNSGAVNWTRRLRMQSATSQASFCALWNRDAQKKDSPISKPFCEEYRRASPWQ
jgi:hypothetical protein